MNAPFFWWEGECNPVCTLKHSGLKATFIFLYTRVDTFYDCLIIACLRRLQEWSYVSILAEFRQHTWPHKLHDFEQVIEKFNTALVDLPVNVPEFLSIHDNFKVGI